MELFILIPAYAPPAPPPPQHPSTYYLVLVITLPLSALEKHLAPTPGVLMCLPVKGQGGYLTQDGMIRFSLPRI